MSRDEIPTGRDAREAWADSFEADRADAALVLHLDAGPRLLYIGAMSVLVESCRDGAPVLVWHLGEDGRPTHADGERLAVFPWSAVRLILDAVTDPDTGEAHA